MIYLNIGSNLTSIFGDKLENIKKSVIELTKLDIKIIKISSFYETPSYPDKKKPKFLNICVKLKTKLSALNLLIKLKKIEKLIGRRKSQKNAPRVCDIDILDFNKQILDSKNLVIPHPKTHLRNFVLYPLKEIEPNWVHPIFNKKIDFFISQLSLKSHIEITRIKKNGIII
jgi:2-amino-4-hydroxy-6-hydroxymethyldihydropteridine diphosphokinase